ncbi:ribbon-helix-helix protein, CopG family [uncultured Selenomonas sp.]|uniref:ribbon-helix-helix protein, CopG family n=1 Tax=uncultured Selenomonas sp. TaxID=159275 RepID=UPI0028E452C9|nr:ribbon-helix-helix protein, CopG family [uncultured Selenomonas sp.]
MGTKLVITKKKRGEDGHKTLSIRVREDIIDRLDDLAGQTGRSRNELIGLLLNFALNNSEVVAER